MYFRNAKLGAKLQELEERMNNAEQKYTTANPDILNQGESQKQDIQHLKPNPAVLMTSYDSTTFDTRPNQVMLQNAKPVASSMNTYDIRQPGSGREIQYDPPKHESQLHLNDEKQPTDLSHTIKPVEPQPGLSLDAVRQLNSAQGNIYVIPSPPQQKQQPPPSKIYSVANIGNSIKTTSCTSQRRGAPETASSVAAKQLIIEKSVISKQGDKLSLDVSQMFNAAQDDSGYQATSAVTMQRDDETPQKAKDQPNKENESDNMVYQASGVGQVPQLSDEILDNATPKRAVTAMGLKTNEASAVNIQG